MAPPFGQWLPRLGSGSASRGWTDDWSGKDIDAVVAIGTTWSTMTGYLHGDLYDAAGGEILVSTAKQAVEVAKRIGCPRLVVHGAVLDGSRGGLPCRPQAVTPVRMWLNAYRTLEKLGDLAKANGVVFCFENCVGQHAHLGHAVAKSGALHLNACRRHYPHRPHRATAGSTRSRPTSRGRPPLRPAPVRRVASPTQHPCGVRASRGLPPEPGLRTLWFCSVPSATPIAGGLNMSVRRASRSVGTRTWLTTGRCKMPWGSNAGCRTRMRMPGRGALPGASRLRLHQSVWFVSATVACRLGRTQCGCILLQ